MLSKSREPPHGLSAPPLELGGQKRFAGSRTSWNKRKKSQLSRAVQKCRDTRTQCRPSASSCACVGVRVLCESPTASTRTCPATRQALQKKEQLAQKLCNPLLRKPVPLYARDIQPQAMYKRQMSPGTDTKPGPHALSSAARRWSYQRLGEEVVWWLTGRVAACDWPPAAGGLSLPWPSRRSSLELHPRRSCLAPRR